MKPINLRGKSSPEYSRTSAAEEIFKTMGPRDYQLVTLDEGKWPVREKKEREQEKASK